MDSKIKINTNTKNDWNWDSGDTNYKITSTNVNQEPIKIDTGKKQSVSGNISIGPSGNVSPDNNLEVDGTIQVDPEQHEKKRAASKKQREKLEKLKEHMIDFLSENNIGHSQTKRWKSDLETIEKMRESLQSDFENYFSHGSVNILDPSEMETLNEIYNRWR